MIGKEQHMWEYEASISSKKSKGSGLAGEEHPKAPHLVAGSIVGPGDLSQRFCFFFWLLGLNQGLACVLRVHSPPALRLFEKQ